MKKLHAILGPITAALICTAIPSAFAQTAVTETQTTTTAPAVPVAPVTPVAPTVVEHNTTTTTSTDRGLTHEEKEHAKKELRRDYKEEKEKIEHDR